MMPCSSTTVPGDMVGKVNESMCFCRGGHWSIGGVSESDVRGGGDDFLVSLRILWFGGGLHVSVWQWMAWLWWVARSWILIWWTLELWFWSWILLLGVVFVWSWVVWRNGLLVEWLVWRIQPVVFRGFQCWWRVLGEVTEVHVLNILVDINFEDFYYNFCDGGRLQKEWKQGKGLDWPRILISLSNTWNENTNGTFCHQPSPTDDRSTPCLPLIGFQH